MSDISQDTSFDSAAALDERQRSMLEAMGIKLWLPNAEPDLDLATATATTPAAMMKTANPVRTEHFDQKHHLAGIKSAQNATEIIASPVTPPVRTSLPSAMPAPAPGIPSIPIVLSPRPAGIEQMDWASLQSAVSSCEACALCRSRKNTVFGVGPAPADAALAPQVDWLIVGEAPGENEDVQGEPFVSQSGKLLDNMLAAMKVGAQVDGQASGLSRESGVYIANVIKCRPPDNRNPTAAEIATCEPYLARQIELLRPKMILAMGKFAISTVTGSNEPVGKLRGRVHKLNHPSYSAPVIVTYHPAYLLRNLPMKAHAWADLMLAMQTFTALPRN